MKVSFVFFFPRAFLLFVTFVWASTVLLSVSHLMTRPAMSIVSILFLILTGYIIRRNKILVVFPRSKVSLIVFALFALTFVQGFVSAPNTTDSMIYHLPRVMYWMQEKSIFLDHKVTSHDYMPALSESLVLYFMLLTGNDRLAFLPQWFAGASVVCTTMLIARKLGLDNRSQTLSVLFVATLPILLLESVSTQTDLMMAAFLTLSVYFSLRKEIVSLALSVALGIITKQAIAVFAFIPLGIILPNAWNVLKTRFRWVIVSICLFILVITPYFISNLHLYGTLLGSQVTASGQTLILTNERMSPNLLLSNVIRNLLIQTPLPFVGKYIDPHISNDQSTTWYGSRYTSLSVFIPQEDIASAPIQLVLIIGALVLCFRVGVDSKQRRVLLFIVLSFLLFCVVLKWQPYNPRLEMSLIIVAIPAVVGILSKYKKALSGFALLSVMLGLMTIVANTSHPFFSYDVIFSRLKSFAPAGVQAPQSIFLQPREQQYFSARPYWYKPYVQMSESLHSAQLSSVKLDLFDEFTYPLMVALHTRGIRVDIASTATITSFSKETVFNQQEICYVTDTNYGRICSP